MTSAMGTFLGAIGSLLHSIFAGLFFVVLLAVAVVILGGSQAVTFVQGLLRLFLSIFVSPWLFLRKAVAATAQFTRRKEADDLASDQYLLNRAMWILQGAVVVLSIAAFAGGLTVAWRGVIPRKEVRERYGQVRSELGSLRDTMRDAKKMLDEFDQNWKKNRAGVVAKFREDSRTQMNQAQAEMNNLGAALGSISAFRSVAQELQKVRVTDGPSRFEEAKVWMEEAMASWWLSSDVRRKLRSYVSAWHSFMTASYNTSYASEEEIYGWLRGSLDERFAKAKEAVGAKEAELNELWSYKSALSRALGGSVLAVVIFLAVVWFLGMTIEWWWMLIKLADNVRVIREEQEKRSMSA